MGPTPPENEFGSIQNPDVEKCARHSRLSETNSVAF